MQQTVILGILVFDRIKEAGKTQGILSKHASIIRTRLGFHELSASVCSRVGTILLILKGDPEQWKLLEGDLQEIGGIEVKRMAFEHLS